MNRRDTVLAFLALGSAPLALLLGACAHTGAPTLSSERIAEILASPDRRAADRTNDTRRKPQEMLAFIGLRPGMVAHHRMGSRVGRNRDGTVHRSSLRDGGSRHHGSCLVPGTRVLPSKRLKTLAFQANDGNTVINHQEDGDYPSS